MMPLIIMQKFPNLTSQCQIDTLVVTFYVEKFQFKSIVVYFTSHKHHGTLNTFVLGIAIMK